MPSHPRSIDNSNDSESKIPPALVVALHRARHVVVFTGAGVSAESGVPTFRDALTGLWERFNAEDLATPSAFSQDRELVWGWYEWRRMRVLQVQPNPAHHAIAALARRVPRLTLITQNVDDLHERAGSESVVHLHGSLHHPRCRSCGQPHLLAPGIPDEPDGGRRLTPPRCIHCDDWIRPGVVWFGEALPQHDWNQAQRAVLDCDLLFSIGTSSLVYPAAELPHRAAASGASVAQVNPQPTSLDSIATWNIRGAAGAILAAVVDAAWLGK